MEDQDSFLTSSLSHPHPHSSHPSHPHPHPSHPHPSHPSHPHPSHPSHPSLASHSHHHQPHQQASHPPQPPQPHQHQHQHQHPYLFGSHALSTFAPSLSLTSSASAPVLPSSSLPSLSLPLALSLAAPDQHGGGITNYSYNNTSTNTATSSNRRAAASQLQSARNKRTKLSTEERAKVLEIRRQRACLRCKMLKIQCSRDNPCKPCLSSAVRGYERKVLSFCYCVRTRFADVDIFHSGDDAVTFASSTGPAAGPAASPPPQDVPASIRRLMDQIEPPALPAIDSTPDNAFEDTLLRWLTAEPHSHHSGIHGHAPTSGSIVAMLYALVGQSDSLRRAVDAHVPADFQTFLFTTSLVHTGWTSPAVSLRDLCVAGHVCGSRLVQRLDRILTPQFLAKCDKDTHRALLLLVVGLILGVSYSTRLTTSPAFPHALLGLEMRHSPTLWLALKEHLAQMLAHHLIFLGSTLGIKLDTAAEKTIIETAVHRWNKPERSLWAERGVAASHTHSDSEIALISRVFGLRGIDDDLGALHDLSGLPTAQTPRTIATAGDAEREFERELERERPLPAPPLVAVTYPDLADLQAMPQATTGDDGDDGHGLDDEHAFYARPYDHAHDAILDNNPESFYNMSNDDLTGLLSPITATATANAYLDDARPPSADKQDEDEDEDEEEQESGTPTPAPTPAAKTASVPPPPSRSAMGDDAVVRSTHKKRSVWIVRPYTDGDTQEPVNVYARFRVHQGQNLGLFV